jgi:hypothetical protein
MCAMTRFGVRTSPAKRRSDDPDELTEAISLDATARIVFSVGGPLTQE